MRAAWSSRRAWWVFGLTVGGLLALLTTTVILAGVAYWRGADFPGATYTGDHLIYKIGPVPTLRRDASYTSTAPFNKIYNWYSVGFNLGPEAYAQSQCITMVHSFTDFRIIEREMSVTVCDTSTGRMMFVMRSLSLRWH